MNSFETIYLKETESTNTYAKALLKSGEPCAHFTLIYAENQTKGRGRLGREWLSKKGDTLCMSLISPYPHNPAITLLSALGVHKALAKITDADIKIKWPNDLITENKKLCGILTESTDKYAVIGIGINLNTEVFSEEIEHKATSLKLVTGKRFIPEEIAEIVAEEVIAVLQESGGNLSEEIIRQYTKLCANIGREIVFGENIGIATGISLDGCLEVLRNNATEYIRSGEVTISGIY
ncbi:MAG: biotin--[Ruminococcus sp.]|nr:biotin--[acetyl-CoA-carboxylase] ligase [Ruminococcus sp.]